MERHVLDHEPHLALFVPDDDSLLFYRAIARYASLSLTPGGSLYFEINPLYATELSALLSAMSYHDIALKNDQFGKPRMIKATR
jgi:release factor glutamine methyltransferase